MLLEPVSWRENIKSKSEACPRWVLLRASMAPRVPVGTAPVYREVRGSSDISWLCGNASSLFVPTAGWIWSQRSRLTQGKMDLEHLLPQLRPSAIRIRSWCNHGVGWKWDPSSNRLCKYLTCQGVMVMEVIWKGKQSRAVTLHQCLVCRASGWRHFSLCCCRNKIFSVFLLISWNHRAACCKLFNVWSFHLRCTIAWLMEMQLMTQIWPASTSNWYRWRLFLF